MHLDAGIALRNAFAYDTSLVLTGVFAVVKREYIGFGQVEPGQ